jgi:hypothetical protein
MCLFDFHKADLTAACLHQRSLKKDWGFKTDDQLVELLPLKTWKRTVRRRYLEADVQAQRINKWRETYLLNESIFVDTTVAGQARPLVRGGAEGLQKFEKVLLSQLELVHKGMLSGECQETWPLYFHRADQLAQQQLDLF